MRSVILIATAAVALGACSKGSPQADALDHAATQADPAAAAAMRNAADEIRANGADANLSDPNSPAQAAMADAGAAAAGVGNAAQPDNGFGTRELVTPRAPAERAVGSGSDVSSAKPHQAGQPVPGVKKPTG